MNIYISEKAADWLLEEKNPVIRYLALRDLDLPGRRSREEDYLNAEQFLFSGKNLSFFKNYDSSNFDLRKKGSVWKLGFISECGINSQNPIVSALIEDIIKHSYMPDGAFSLNTNPHRECGFLTGDMLKFMLSAGYGGEEIHACAQWIASNQRFDGGWLQSPFYTSFDILAFVILNRPGDIRKAEKYKDAPSCIYASALCLEGLIEYSKLFGKYREEIKIGVSFLSNHAVFNGERKVSSSDHLLYNSDISKPGYPLLGQIDIVRLLLILKKGDALTDAKYGRFLNALIAQMDEFGRWKNLSKARGMMNTGYRTGSPDKWVTLNVLRLLKESI